MKKKLHEIEKVLRNGKLPHKDLSGIREMNWQKILQAQRKRRKPQFFLSLPPWSWALASIVLILLCVVFMLLLK
ncbi:MAG: hypothetical protein ACE5HS_19950 [bacterium]